MLLSAGKRLPVNLILSVFELTIWHISYSCLTLTIITGLELIYSIFHYCCCSEVNALRSSVVMKSVSLKLSVTL